MSPDSLADYLKRAMEPPGQEVLDAIERGPIDPGAALALDCVDRLLDPAPLPRETGWCVLPDGIAYVAVRTAMPHVSGAMVDWWFDWHPREALRYRIWHPAAHRDNSLEGASEAGAGEGVGEGVGVSPQGVPYARAREKGGVVSPRGGGLVSPRGVPRAHAHAKAHWGAVHHPVEDVGTGMVHARIEFKAPTEMGMSSDALDDPHVATIVCGYAGDDRLRVRHSPMFHVFLADADADAGAGAGADAGAGAWAGAGAGAGGRREGESGRGGNENDDGEAGGESGDDRKGVVLRSRFWLGAALRPYGPLGGVGEVLLNRPSVRRRALPKGLPRALARHCAQEYANLGAILPELYERFGPGDSKPG